MRSTLISAALAVGACAKVIEMEVYVTEWTTTTVTETVTQWPTNTHNPVTPADKDTVAADSASSTSTLPSVDLTRKATTIEQTDVIGNLGGVTTWYSTAYWTIPAQPLSTETPTSLETTTAPAATPATPANDYQEQVLDNHNVHRSNHSANPLTWSSDLEASARILAERCVYEHNTTIPGGSCGQNIGYGVAESSIGVMITNLMYNDEMMFFANLYGQAFPDTSNFDAWGHFSQIVWKSTKQVGCATVVCPSLQNAGGSNVPFTVCNYFPPGNFDGKYAENVLAPKGSGVVSV